MSDFKCPMCSDCPDNCPLDSDTDTREHSADYYKGKLDGAREFAEWLANGNTFIRRIGSAEMKTIDELLAEWQKGAENDDRA